MNVAHPKKAFNWCGALSCRLGRLLRCGPVRLQREIHVAGDQMIGKRMLQDVRVLLFFRQASAFRNRPKDSEELRSATRVYTQAWSHPQQKGSHPWRTGALYQLALVDLLLGWT